MARRQKKADPPPPGSPLWMATFSDMITQVLAFFILLFSFSSVNEQKFKDAVASLQAALGVLPASTSIISAPVVRPGTGGSSLQFTQQEEQPLSTVQRQLKGALADYNVEQFVRLEPAERALVIHFDSALLFDSGHAIIKTEAIPALDAIGRVLSGMGNQIRVEGHTDSDPILSSPLFPDNWALGSGRAHSVLTYMKVFHNLPDARMSIASYADTRPVASNSTPDGKSKNRRVDIVVLGR